MIIGVFSPVINWCGGAEWVAIDLITALKEHGHQVIVLSDKPLNQSKFEHVFGRKLSVDQQMIFPFRFFSSTNYHNIYTDAIRCLMLKTKCEVVIDTFSNAILPGVEISYIHHPLLKRVKAALPITRNKAFFYPYKSYLDFSKNKVCKKLIFANSRFTADAIKTEIGINPHVLYPPVSSQILNFEDLEKQRENNVITVSRICPQKKLDIIPHIAKSCDKEISFTIIGLLDSQEALNSIVNLAKDLDVSERIKIITNAKRADLRRALLNSKVYLNTSTNEHFGISIVEAMASGCIPVVHNSGGPKEFVPSNQRFNNIDEAVDMVKEAFDGWSPTQARKYAKMAELFSEKNFSKQFINIFNSYIHGENYSNNQI